MIMIPGKRINAMIFFYKIPGMVWIVWLLLMISASCKPAFYYLDILSSAMEFWKFLDIMSRVLWSVCHQDKCVLDKCQIYSCILFIIKDDLSEVRKNKQGDTMKTNKQTRLSNNLDPEQMCWKLQKPLYWSKKNLLIGFIIFKTTCLSSKLQRTNWFSKICFGCQVLKHLYQYLEIRWYFQNRFVCWNCELKSVVLSTMNLINGTIFFEL